MKAITCRRYGPPAGVLRLEDMPTPVPKPGQVLVKVHAASVNAADWHIVRADPWLARLAVGLLRPKHSIPGADAAGRVEAVGRGVTRLRAGDAVFGDLSGCGFGAFAEYVCAPEGAWTLKPAHLGFEEAAAVPMAGGTALQALRDAARLQPGQAVLIHGAGGGVGTFAVQIAQVLGAEVTAVCHTRNVERMRALGAAHVLDYTREDFARNGRRYDVILAVGGNRSIFDYRRSLAPKGRYVLVGGANAQFYQALLLAPWLSLPGGRKLGPMLAVPRAADLEALGAQLEAGTVRPVVDRRYPLRQVPEAIGYVESGRATGKVVITM